MLSSFTEGSIIRPALRSVKVDVKVAGNNVLRQGRGEVHLCR
jgi:hypothetical protein